MSIDNQAEKQLQTMESMARQLALIEELIRSRANTNAFERDEKYIAALDTVTLTPPPFARAVVMTGISSWTIATLGSMAFNYSGPTVTFPILSPGAHIDVTNTGSTAGTVTIAFLGEGPSQLLGAMLSTQPVTTAGIPQVSAVLTGSLALEADTFDVPTTAGALPTQSCNEVLIQAGLSNADNVSIGNSTAQPISLAPGQSVSLSIANLNLVYAVAAATGNTLGWMVRS